MGGRLRLGRQGFGPGEEIRFRVLDIGEFLIARSIIPINHHMIVQIPPDLPFRMQRWGIFPSFSVELRMSQKLRTRFTPAACFFGVPVTTQQ